MINRLLAAALAFAALCLANLAALAAADPYASDWNRGQKAAARLIAAGAPGGGVQAGIEIALEAKTHTYWRVPGDAGVPPVVSFEGSTNLASAELLFPAPLRLIEEGAVIFGYEGDVVLPLVVIPTDMTKPVSLKVKINYAACERICVPVEASLALVLPGDGKAGPNAALLADALARVPQTRALAAAGPLALLGLSYGTGDGTATGKPRFGVDVRVPEAAKTVTLLPLAAEGWFLVIAPGVATGPGLWHFAVSVDDMPKDGGSAPVATSFVLIADDRAIEVATTLDAGRLKP